MSDDHSLHFSLDHAEPDGAAHWESRTAPRVADVATTNTSDSLRFVEWLPRLGTVLWMYRNASDRMFPRARLQRQGVLLLDHPALTAFADSVKVSAQGSVGAQGPREWLELHDANGAALARLYLLPDTDYLAWDAMLVDCHIERARTAGQQRWHAHTAFMRGAFARLRTSWQAQAARFPIMHLPCLQLLGLRAPAALSTLGAQLAAAIAHDAGATLLDARA